MLIPQIWEYSTLHSKIDIADVIKSRAMRQGDYPGYLSEPLNGEEEDRIVKGRYVVTETRSE